MATVSAQRLLQQEIRALPDDLTVEVLDFVQFLKARRGKMVSSGNRSRKLALTGNSIQKEFGLFHRINFLPIQQTRKTLLDGLPPTLRPQVPPEPRRVAR